MEIQLRDDEIPYFAWDRPWTVAMIKEKLRTLEGVERDRVLAWILREAAPRHVWAFTTPREVYQSYGRLERVLGRRREFWRVLLEIWHELGLV